MSDFRKPARWLSYPPGTVADWRDQGLKRVHVHCAGPPEGKRCGHQETLRLEDLRDATWHDICARFRCKICGSLGYVSIQPAWSDVIDFSKPSGHRK